MTSSGRLIALLVVVVLALAGSTLLFARNDSPTSRSGRNRGAEPNDESANASPGPEASPGSGLLLYLRGRTVHALDLDDRNDRVLAEMPTKDVWVSPAGPWLAYVVPEEPLAESEPDFIPDPTLRVVNLETTDDLDLGRGIQPTWHPADERLASLRPVDDRECSGESCTGPEELVVYDLESDQESVLTEPGDYTILGWAGERVLISDARDLSAVTSAGADGTETLDIAPSNVWGASADGTWLLYNDGARSAFLEVATGESFATSLPGPLMDALWSPTEQRVATTVVRGGTNPEIHVIGPGRGGSRIFDPGGEPGILNWSANGKVVVPVRRAARVQDVMMCGTGASCRSAARLRGAVLILGVTPG